jgi:hypothetical protein
LDALGLQKTQGELGVANLHGQRLTPARATAQHAHRFARDKAQLTQAPHQTGLRGPLGAMQCLHDSVCASRQFGQE